MNKPNHTLAWTISIAPPADASPLTARLAAPGGTLRFAAAIAFVSQLALVVLCHAQNLDLHVLDIPFVGAGAMLFAYKYDVHDECHYDLNGRHFLYLAMPIFAYMACFLAGFTAQRSDGAVGLPVGSLFVGMLSLQSFLAFLANAIIRLFA